MGNSCVKAMRPKGNQLVWQQPNKDGARSSSAASAQNKSAAKAAIDIVDKKEEVPEKAAAANPVGHLSQEHN